MVELAKQENQMDADSQAVFMTVINRCHQVVKNPQALT
jgi:hypothetical protein